MAVVSGRAVLMCGLAFASVAAPAFIGCDGASPDNGGPSGGGSTGGSTASSGGSGASAGSVASATGGAAPMTSGGAAPVTSGGRSDGGGGSAAAGGMNTSEGGGAGEAGAGGEGGATQDLLERARSEYRAWRTKTEAAINVSAEIFGLCRLPTALENEFAGSVHGHSYYLLDWLDPEAYAIFEANGAEPFPEGAAIVKEKLVREGGTGKETLAALGIMVKRAPGFDSASGDWEFGYWEPKAGMLRSAELNAKCGACHAGAETDYVFFDSAWRTRPEP